MNQEPSQPSASDAPGVRHAFSFDQLSPDVPVVKLLGIDYAHLKTEDGGDLYVTKYGLPCLENLKPENWYEKEWFKEHRERLKGTSTVYRVTTKAVDGRGIDIVVKWSRVGQDVPLQTQTIEAALNAEFNSPFEEFALVEEMRTGHYGPHNLKILSHRPLSIYVPPERLQLWQTGRSKYKINMKVRKHPGVELDILRQYILMYEWIKGVDAAEAFEQLKIDEKQLHGLTHKVEDQLNRKGFLVADMKPAHIIVRKQNDGDVLHRHDEILYALVDFELLQRTPDYEEEIQKDKRAQYLARLKESAAAVDDHPLPAYLKQVNIFGVDYIYGHVESTGGALWVVGHDPYLYDYFQPERWRKTQQVKLSESHHVYYTRTKDNIYLVWKASRVGEIPEVDAKNERGRKICEHGYNSPFEEFAYALDLNRRGVAATYPRAIYMAGPQSESADYIADQRRYQSHASLLTPDGEPILRPDHDYIKIWGFWNGPDELRDDAASEFYHGLDAMEAVKKGLLSEKESWGLMEKMQQKLAKAGYETLNLDRHHLLLCANSDRYLIPDADGYPKARLCNFELTRKLV